VLEQAAEALAALHFTRRERQNPRFVQAGGDEESLKVDTLVC
jgi:hypothetical protein